MRGFILRDTSLTLRFTFDKILPILPGPGTATFARLSGDLRPYGMAASGVVVEWPSSRLSEVSVGISLLNGRANLRLLYGWFELAVFQLFDKDLEHLSGIVGIVQRALTETDTDANRGQLRIDCLAHLELEPGEANRYLREHLPTTASVLVPDAFAFRFVLEGVEELRVVVARSVRFEGALFVDYSIVHKPTDAPIRPLAELRQQYDSALANLGLERLVEPEAGGV